MGGVLTQLRPVAACAAAEAVDTVHRALDEVPVVPGVTDPTRLIGEVDRAITRLEALRLDLVRAADRAQVSAASGASGTAAWLASATRTDTASASRDVKLAAALCDSLPATREALAQGTLSTAHAQVIATATNRLPESLTDRALGHRVGPRRARQAGRPRDPAQGGPARARGGGQESGRGRRSRGRGCAV